VDTCLTSSWTSVLGLVTGPLAPVVGLAAGTAHATVENVVGRVPRERSWMAAGIKLRRLASRREPT
jgi:hypothetical protein